jgi:hypothetical protein
MLTLSPTVGDSWFSTAWGNNKPRTFANNPVDQYDSRFLTGRLAAKQLSIDGQGTTTITEPTRMFVSCSWLNTQTVVFVYVPKETNGVLSLRSRSNHETKCRFGDYVIIYELTYYDPEF